MKDKIIDILYEEMTPLDMKSGNGTILKGTGIIASPSFDKIAEKIDYLYDKKRKVCIHTRKCTVRGINVQCKKTKKCWE